MRTEINPVWLRKILREIAQAYPLDVHTLGEERFLARLAQPLVFQTESVRGIAQRLIGWVQAINYKNWIGRLIVKLNGHYPIILIATRTRPLTSASGDSSPRAAQ